MHYIITFSTSKFDVTLEDQNPVNPIHGQSLLLWLKNRVAATALLTEPATEDWGWYSTMAWQGRVYLLGASADKSDSVDEYDWVFQVDKQRSFMETLFGRHKMTESDGCLLFFKAVFDAEPSFKNVKIE
ncbi:MAG: hypothetical protein CTY19_04580 [Methylomonas sp.]|nr:MAG: hypothetical protein CTY19_04580 [Methylomonas sp.]